MSKPIKAGDLVAIVRVMPCCGSHMNVGVHFVVDRIGHVSGMCGACNAFTSAPAAWGKSDGWPTLVSRLKRIPPLEKLESEKRDEKLTEPA